MRGMTTSEKKPWYQSQTIIAAITTGGIALAGAFNIQIADLSSNIMAGLLGVGALISVGFTIAGRVKANKKIG